MELADFFKQMWQKKTTVIIITIFVLLLTVAITLTQPLRYSVTTRLLVVQNYSAGTDAYGIARSNQYLSNVLAQVVYSDAFYDSVMNSGFNISAANFPANDTERRKFWLDMVDARAINDTGMIEVVIYHQDKRFADQVNRAVAYILQTKNNEYHGLGDKVRVKIIDNSMTSVWPVKPNLLINSLFGLFLGLILSACYIKLWPNQEIILIKTRAPKNEVAVPYFETVRPISGAETPAKQTASVPAAIPEVPMNLPVSETPVVQANPFLQNENKKFEGDISNIMN